MKGTAERRLSLLIALCKRKCDTADNLAFEFGVSERTIRHDIEILSLDFPVFTVSGRHGGVFIEENYRLGMQYLTEREQTLLEEILPLLEGEKREMMVGILCKFSKGGSGKYDA